MASQNSLTTKTRVKDIVVDYDEEEDDLLSNKEVERLTSLWKSMKDTKKPLNSCKSFMAMSSTGMLSQLHNSFNQPASAATPSSQSLPQRSQSQQQSQQQSQFQQHQQQSTLKIRTSESYSPESRLNVCNTLTTALNTNPSAFQIPSSVIHLNGTTSTMNVSGAIAIHTSTSDTPIAPKDLKKQLIRKSREYEIEIASCHEKIAKLLTQNQSQSQELETMKIKLEDYTNSQKQVIEKFRENTLLIEQRLSTKEKVCSDLSDEVTFLKKEIQRLLTSNNHLQAENDHMLAQIEDKHLQNQSFEQKIQELDNIPNTQKEISSLKEDLTRLATLLLSTKEYKNFVFSAEDIQQIHFLRTHADFIHNYNNFESSQVIPHSSHQDRLNSTSSLAGSRMGRRNCSGCQKDNPATSLQNSRLAPSRKRSNSSAGRHCVAEQKLWLPKDAFAFLSDFTQRNHLNITEQLSEELLFGIHAIMLKHSSANSTAHSRLEQLTKINSELKKQLARNQTFDEVHAKAKISRLRSELSNARKRSADTHLNKTTGQINFLNTSSPAIKSYNSNSNYFDNSRRGSSCLSRQIPTPATQVTEPPTRGRCLSNHNREKMIYFSEALRLFSEYESDIRLAKEKIAELDKQLKATEDDTAACDKIIYMEGAMWVLSKTLRELKRINENTQNASSSLEISLQEDIITSSNYSSSVLSPLTSNSHNVAAATTTSSQSPTLIAIASATRAQQLVKQFLANIHRFHASVLDKFLQHKESTLQQIAKYSKITAQSATLAPSKNLKSSRKIKDRSYDSRENTLHALPTREGSTKKRRSIDHSSAKTGAASASNYESNNQQYQQQLLPLRSRDSNRMNQQQQQQTTYSQKEQVSSSAVSTPLQQYFSRSKRNQDIGLFDDQNHFEDTLSSIGNNQ